MKKYITIGALALITLASCGGQTTTDKEKISTNKTGKKVKQYTCTMDPDVLKDKPGTCPKCGMELVEKDK